MYEEIKHDRRSFLRAGAMSIVAASLGIMGSVVQQARLQAFNYLSKGNCLLSPARMGGSIRRH